MPPAPRWMTSVTVPRHALGRGSHRGRRALVDRRAECALLDGLVEAVRAGESRTYDELSFFFTKGVGYGIEMILRPQTLYGLADSPIAL